MAERSEPVYRPVRIGSRWPRRSCAATTVSSRKHWSCSPKRATTPPRCARSARPRESRSPPSITSTAARRASTGRSSRGRSSVSAADMVRALADDGTLRERLVRMARAYVEATLREPDLARFIMALIHNPPAVGAGHGLRAASTTASSPSSRARWTRRWPRRGRPGAHRGPPPRLHGRAGRGDARAPAGGTPGADARRSPTTLVDTVLGAGRRRRPMIPGKPR